MFGGVPPGLLQIHSSTGELHYKALVQHPRSSGELLVNSSELSQHLVGQRFDQPVYCSTTLNRARY